MEVLFLLAGMGRRMVLCQMQASVYRWISWVEYGNFKRKWIRNVLHREKLILLFCVFFLPFATFPLSILLPLAVLAFSEGDALIAFAETVNNNRRFFPKKKQAAGWYLCCMKYWSSNIFWRIKVMENPKRPRYGNTICFFLIQLFGNKTGFCFPLLRIPGPSPAPLFPNKNDLYW